MNEHKMHFLNSERVLILLYIIKDSNFRSKKYSGRKNFSICEIR